MDIYERLDELDATTAETKAARILHGLGRWDSTPVGVLIIMKLLYFFRV